MKNPPILEDFLFFYLVYDILESIIQIYEKILST